MYQNILFEVKDHIAFVTINRPEKLNALNNQTMLELKDVFTKIKNDNDIYVVIITGSGEKAFVAGADIAELNKLDAVSGREFAERGQEVFNLIENLGKPVIAAINGYALGGGSELVGLAISELPPKTLSLVSQKLTLESSPDMVEHKD